MELRVLKYFLMVAREQSFTKAAAQLHITQPTLSRQITALEEELHTRLLNRSGHNITLTEAGLLLKRRALEILDLEERILDEFSDQDDLIEGKVNIGCGEFAAVEILAEICESFREKYPRVQIAIHTGTADDTLELMNKGLVDVGLFLEPVDTSELEYIRIRGCDHWVVGLRPEDPLVQQEYVMKEDLLDLPLILPERLSVQSEIANWFGKDFDRIHVAFTSNLGTNAGVMACMAWDTPFPSKGRRGTGEKICWCSGGCIRRLPHLL